MPWECFHLRPTTNKCAPVSGFYNWPEVVQLRKHDAAGRALLHFESFLSLSFLFHLSRFGPPLLLFPFSSYFLRPPTPLPPMPPTRHCQHCEEIYREDGWIIRIWKSSLELRDKKTLIWNVHLYQIYEDPSYHFYNLNNIHNFIFILTLLQFLLSIMVLIKWMREKS